MALLDYLEVDVQHSKSPFEEQESDFFRQLDYQSTRLRVSYALASLDASQTTSSCRTTCDLLIQVVTYVPKNGKSGTYIANLRLWDFIDFFKKTYNKGNFIRIIFPITVHDGAHDNAHDNSSVSKTIRILVSCIEGEVDRDTLQSLIGIKHRTYFRNTFIKPDLEEGYIEFTLPNEKQSKLQKY